MATANWYGTYCLSLREVRRFLRVYHQTIITPAISSLVFLAIFGLSLANHPNKQIASINYIDFIGYGLIIMSISQNAFANSSSSVIMSKIIGYIRDLFVLPFRSSEIIIAFTIGSVLRGIFVGLVVTLALAPFISYQLQHPLLLFFYLTASCSLLGQLGILSGLYSESFDQQSAFTNYLITPLSFLSGTFYSVNALPSYIQAINYFNPFFYIIDGFRYCLTGHHDGNILHGSIILILGNIILYQLLVRLIDKGWRIKS
jgi:ABC-2 type transport system permease protein